MASERFTARFIGWPPDIYGIFGPRDQGAAGGTTAMEELLQYKKEEDIRRALPRTITSCSERPAANETACVHDGGLTRRSCAGSEPHLRKVWAGHAACRRSRIDYRPLFERPRGRRSASRRRIPGDSVRIIHGGDCEPFSGWEAGGFPMPEPDTGVQAVSCTASSSGAGRARVVLW